MSSCMMLQSMFHELVGCYHQTWQAVISRVKAALGCHWWSTRTQIKQAPRPGGRRSIHSLCLMTYHRGQQLGTYRQRRISRFVWWCYLLSRSDLKYVQENHGLLCWKLWQNPLLRHWGVYLFFFGGGGVCYIICTSKDMPFRYPIWNR